MHHTKQALKEGDSEKNTEWVRSIGEDQQLRARRIHEAKKEQKGFTAVASEATLKCMNSEISLSCEGIERFLGEDDSRVHALRGVSLQLERGTVHAVVGPSGCGKSTLLYILGLLDHADTGSVTIENEAVSHLADDALAKKRNELLGFIFQFHFLLEDFTAQENVMIPMRRLGDAERAGDAGTIRLFAR